MAAQGATRTPPEGSGVKGMLPGRSTRSMTAATIVRLGDGRSGLVRRASPDDAEGITALVNTVGAEGRFVLRDRATWTLEEERQTLAAADGTVSVFLVAELSERICGMMNLSRGRWPKNSHVAEFGMSCLPECRRIGLGAALLAQGIEWARDGGVRKLALEVFASNEAAISLYRKMGFEVEARLKGEFVIDGAPVDGLRMALWL